MQPVHHILYQYQVNVGVTVRGSVRVIQALDRVTIHLMKSVNLRLCRGCYCWSYGDWRTNDDHNRISKRDEGEPAAPVSQAPYWSLGATLCHINSRRKHSLTERGAKLNAAGVRVGGVSCGSTCTYPHRYARNTHSNEQISFQGTANALYDCAHCLNARFSPNA